MLFVKFACYLYKKLLIFFFFFLRQLKKSYFNLLIVVSRLIESILCFYNR